MQSNSTMLVERKKNLAQEMNKQSFKYGAYLFYLLAYSPHKSLKKIHWGIGDWDSPVGDVCVGQPSTLLGLVGRRLAVADGPLVLCPSRAPSPSPKRSTRPAS